MRGGMRDLVPVSCPICGRERLVTPHTAYCQTREGINRSCRSCATKGKIKKRFGDGPRGTEPIDVQCSGCGKVRRITVATHRRNERVGINKCQVCANAERGREKVFLDGRHIPGCFYRDWRCSGLARKLAWTVTLEDLDRLWESQQGLCALSGLPLQVVKGDRHRVSLDRIDSRGGYTLNNVQLLCAVVNVMKLDLGQSEFVTLCKVIAERRQGEPLVFNRIHRSQREAA